jgi:hypothetical protein
MCDFKQCRRGAVSFVETSVVKAILHLRESMKFYQYLVHYLSYMDKIR